MNIEYVFILEARCVVSEVAHLSFFIELYDHGKGALTCGRCASSGTTPTPNTASCIPTKTQYQGANPATA